MSRERCLRLCHRCSHVSPDRAELCEKEREGVFHCLAWPRIQTCWVRKALGQTREECPQQITIGFQSLGCTSDCIWIVVGDSEWLSAVYATMVEVSRCVNST